ncbi:apolipoprotein D [Zootermopsis nevadensis]|uniref:Apolipoprotein D n=1 Tax=Zootermopsis nevadensis TaxID=136037 RepID=A0A067QUM8_ZOONE|nr:apolipoprotein D [Zootermopsis nevadensis]KDR12765.1 Apolipoprotein D [Zootermopsis nevadensis]
MSPLFLLTTVIVFLGFSSFGHPTKRREDKTKCPHVRAIRNFDLHELLGSWFVVQYYASSEEALSYGCMRPVFSVSPDRLQVSMNFTYTFTDDPASELLYGNITWEIPEPNRPSHWVHAEDTYEGVYNTYVLDSDYKSWALLLHCAEKSKSPRYLSSFIMSRQPILASNVVTYLREKLPRYDIDLAYMFPMVQTNCSVGNRQPGLDRDTVRNILKQSRKHPMKL